MSTTATPGPALARHARQAAVGTLQDFLASALSLPTGIVTAAFLTRSLGPENYGLFTVAAVIVVWIELVISIGFNRTAVKFIVESSEWETVASSFVQAQLLVALAAAGLLAAAAPILAMWLKAGELSTYLRIFALDIPIYALANIHRSVLIGRGLFGQRAVLTAFFWLSRMILIIVFVSYRPSVPAAIGGLIATSTLLLAAARAFVRPAIFRKIRFSLKNMWSYAWPLFFYTVATNLFNRIDLLFVKAYSPLPEMAGYYGAAKNLTIVPVLFAVSLSPLLLAKLTALLNEGQGASAAHMTQESMRLVMCLLPFAGMSAGAANEVVAAIYGSAFSPAGDLLALLIFAAVGGALVSTSVSALIAAGRPTLAALVSGPVVLLASGMHYLVVPRWGSIGAAGVTTFWAWAGAVVVMMALFRLWRVSLPVASILRSLAICGGAYFLADYWPSPGLMLLVKLPVVSLLILLAFWVTGEIRSAEMDFFRSLLRRTQSAK